MKDLAENLLRELRGTSLASKVVALLVGAALVAIVGVAAVVSNEPHLQLTFSGLSDHQVAKVSKALADEGVRFETSQPPGPFNVFVDRSDRSRAYKAAYGAGALDVPLKGILAGPGMSSVFQGAEERQQGVRKREWEEMEGMLELLDFVASARVRTSPGTTSPLAGAQRVPMTASVTLRVASGGALGRAQAETVADLVSRGLGVARADIVIADQTGNALFSGDAEEQSDESTVQDLLAHQDDYDERTTVAANRILADILGPGKARVSVRSEWDYDTSTLRTETASGKGGLVSEDKKTSETPLFQGRPVDAVGGQSGISANVADAAALAASGGADDAESAAPPVSKTSEERKEYRPTITLEEKVRFVPVLRRLSVAIFLDESIDAAKAEELEGAIKAAVGYDDERDEYRRVQIPFATIESAEPLEATEPLPVEGRNPLIDRLLERGVEIACAIAFAVVLLRSLRGTAKGARRIAERGSSAAKPDVDPEVLARAQIDELVKADPERVSEILSTWARAERPLSGARP